MKIKILKKQISKEKTLNIKQNKAMNDILLPVKMI